MVQLGKDSFRMGTDDENRIESDGEGPIRDVYLDEFYMDQHAVTNAEFYQFVDDTGYVTDAERYGWSHVFQNHIAEEAQQFITGSLDNAPWWKAVAGGCWYRPFGPGSSIKNRLKHPVVHVSWNDAIEYCSWTEKRLPTEAEWEYAARGGLEGKMYPWGDELVPDEEYRCNIWQGEFPRHNTEADGWDHTAPVDAFDPNGHGLYNVAGNVWEWTADWWTNEHAEGLLENPTGPAKGDQKVIRGGSHLCHRSYCDRYRVAARTRNAPDGTSSNVGFRCAADA